MRNSTLEDPDHLNQWLAALEARNETTTKEIASTLNNQERLTPNLRSHIRKLTLTSIERISRRENRSKSKFKRSTIAY